MASPDLRRDQSHGSVVKHMGNNRQLAQRKHSRLIMVEKFFVFIYQTVR